MAEPKTKPTKQDAKKFLNSIEPEQKRKDALALFDIFTKATGQKAVMWGSAIIGFGMYHFKSERSMQEGDWPLVGFSPRKQNFSLYILTWKGDNTALLANLGKYKLGGGCLYINKLADVDVKLLASRIKKVYQERKKSHA